MKKRVVAVVCAIVLIGLAVGGYVYLKHSYNETPSSSQAGPETVVQPTKDVGSERVVTLYFGNSNADAVVAQKRKVTVNKDESIEAVILRELAKGPASKDLYGIMPEGTKVLSVETKDGTCTINLSHEFIDNHPGGTAGESMTLNSIVNSLTELESIKRVQFLIEGEKRDSYIHSIFNEPFLRNEEMIQK